jgi:hypothetical protein
MYILESLFWLSATLVVYGTVGYPALIWVLAKLAPKPVRKGDILPTVTCVIAARNEERTIRAKLENLLLNVQLIGAKAGSTGAGNVRNCQAACSY